MPFLMGFITAGVSRDSMGCEGHAKSPITKSVFQYSNEPRLTSRSRKRAQPTLDILSCAVLSAHLSLAYVPAHSPPKTF